MSRPLSISNRGRWGAALLSLWCLAAPLSAQHALEYFWDNDPGIGAGTKVQTTAAQGSDMQQVELEMSSLAVGVHTLGIRSYTNKGYSSTLVRTVVVPPSTPLTNFQVEYFWDKDPGVGEATKVEKSFSTEAATIDIPTTSLSTGMHTLGIRAGSSLQWSTTTINQVYVVDTDSNVEVDSIAYFWDKDPGIGLATALPATVVGGKINIDIDADSLSNGLHTFGIRTHATTGNWSATKSYAMMVRDGSQSTIDYLEYFWDEDPGCGKATEIAITAGAMVEIDAIDIPFTNFKDGSHTLVVRARSGERWGYYSKVFDHIPATGVFLDQHEVSVIGFDKEVQLTATVKPDNTSYKQVRWTSDNELLATVDRNGLVTTHREGSLYIRAWSSDSLQVDSCLINISATIPVTSIALDRDRATITGLGNTLALKATVKPDEATVKSVNWISRDNAIATVDSLGMVTGVSDGEVVILARTIDEGREDSCVVRVVETFDNYLTLNKLEAIEYQCVELPVSMSNFNPISAFEGLLYLPDGVTLQGVTLDDRRAASDHVVAFNAQEDGSIKLAAYSPTSAAFVGNSGVVFNLVLQMDTLSHGEYTIEMNEVRLVGCGAEEYRTKAISTALTLYPMLLGDANANQSVTVADAVHSSNYILGYDPTPFLFKAADVTLDSTITVSDIVGTVDIVLNPAGVERRYMQRAESASNSKLVVKGGISAGETKDVAIALQSSIAYTAFQLDLYLPEGVVLNGVTLNDNYNSHSLAMREQEDDAVRVVVFSTTNTLIEVNEPKLLTLNLTADALLPEESVMEVENIRFTTPQILEKRLSSLSVNLQSTTIGVGELDGDQLQIYAVDRVLYIRAPYKQQLQLIDAKGAVISILEVESGLNRFVMEQAGLYIIQGEKVVIH